MFLIESPPPPIITSWHMGSLGAVGGGGGAAGDGACGSEEGQLRERWGSKKGVWVWFREERVGLWVERMGHSGVAMG